MLDKLSKIFRTDQILISKQDLSLFNYDASNYEGDSLAIVRPESIEEIRDLILFAKRHDFTITPRGSGTSLTGASSPTGTVVLDMSYFNKIRAINQQEGWAEVEPYVTVDRLNAFLSKESFFFPINPSSHMVASLGGMAATNASGSYSYRYGAMKEWIIGLEYVDGTGKTYYVDENNSFRDMIGSEGCFGIITKLRLRLTKKIEKIAMGYYRFSNMKALLGKMTLLEAGEHNARILAMEFISRSAYISNPGYDLLVEYDISDYILSESEEKKYFEDKHVQHKKRIFDIFSGKKKEEIPETKNGSKYPWSIYGEDVQKMKAKRENLGAQIIARKYLIMEDPKIPRDKTHEFVKFCDDNDIPLFGHIGKGIFHPNFKTDEREKIGKMFDLVEKLGGKVTGEHGIGYDKKKYLKEEEKKIFSELKSKYDPEFLLNPDKISDGPRTGQQKKHK